MLLITCPYCGARPETEFHYGGEAHVARPSDPSKLSDEEWAEFLFIRDNKKGAYRERWVHSAGCRRWFNVLRNTHTHEIVTSYKVGETVREPRESKSPQPKKPVSRPKKAAPAKPNGAAKPKSTAKSAATKSVRKSKAAAT